MIKEKILKFFKIIRCYLADEDYVELAVKLSKFKTQTVVATYLGEELIDIYWSWHLTDEELMEEAEERLEWYKNDPYWKNYGNVISKIIKIKIPDEN